MFFFHLLNKLSQYITVYFLLFIDYDISMKISKLEKRESRKEKLKKRKNAFIKIHLNT